MDKYIIHPSWLTLIGDEFDKPYFKQLEEFVASERKSHNVYPSTSNVFNALIYPVEDVKVVIIGQDPYHTAGVATGLAFSTGNNKPQPSLRNIYKELNTDPSINFEFPVHGNLSYWSQQGVLLLNTCLTVREGVAGSHRKKGWEKFTDAILSSLSSANENIVYMLWGRDAQKKANCIRERGHILEASHPSPLSAKNFIGCRHFSKCNEILSDMGKSEIDWNVC